MVTLNLSAEDLSKVRYGHSAAWETTASIWMLAGRSTLSVHARGLRRLTTPRVRRAFEYVAPLTATERWIPDTWCPPPVGTNTDPRYDFDAIRDLPRSIAELDLEVLASTGMGRWWAQMGPDEFTAKMADGLQELWSALLEPIWERIEHVYALDAAERERRLMHEGVGAALNGLHPGSSYAGSALDLPIAFCDEHLRAQTRSSGVWLVPSVFRWNKISLAVGTTGPIMVGFPATGIGRVWETSRTAAPGVDSLIGRTRASILAAVGQPRTTTALADQLALAPATVNAHLSTLTSAGLVRRVRHGRMVLYSRTLHGHRLLAGPDGEYRFADPDD